MPIAETVRHYLMKHKVEFEPVPHPKTFSSRETAHAAHVREDHVAKAVIVKDNQGFAMVVIPGSNWVKLEAVNDELDREFVLAEESEVDELFGDCQSGAIPPLGPAYGMETLVDEELMSLANVFFEGGDHTHIVQVTGEAFHELLKGARHGHYSHND
ncbi:MAG: YbaK/EbsC family protein [Gammaproteobacteria bacterium]|nr:YbaK/EbsC family protein [Gammaproteobacteria bacterium]